MYRFSSLKHHVTNNTRYGVHINDNWYPPILCTYTYVFQCYVVHFERLYKLIQKKKLITNGYNVMVIMIDNKDTNSI